MLRIDMGGSHRGGSSSTSLPEPRQSDARKKKKSNRGNSGAPRGSIQHHSRHHSLVYVMFWTQYLS
jgi:hypothetical protein